MAVENDCLVRNSRVASMLYTTQQEGNLEQAKTRTTGWDISFSKRLFLLMLQAV